MSKRSGLSFLEELKRGWIDIGRYRYMFRKIDMETWRDKICPICEKGFTEEVRYFFMSYAIHNKCADTEEFNSWTQKFYEEDYDDDPLSGIPRLPEGTDTDDLP